MALALNQSGYVDLGVLPISDYPFTLTGWFRVPNVPSFFFLMRVHSLTTGSFHALVSENFSSGKAAAVSFVGVTGTARSTTSLIPGQWHHVAGVFESANKRTVMLDGGNTGLNIDNRVFDGATQGQLGSFATSDAVDGAEIAVFNRALSLQEITLLAKGCSPVALPNPSQLAAYHDCVRRVNTPARGPAATVVGSATTVDHPRILTALGRGTQTMPNRTVGPYQIDQEQIHHASASAASLGVAGIDYVAGQGSVAGVGMNQSVLQGEVLS